jgi:hypothetical protein
VAVWRSARLDLARDFDSTAIVRDMQRLAAVLGGYAEHVRVRNILASNDDSIGDPSLVGRDGVSAAGALGTVSVVFQMPAPMLYNLEMLLLVPDERGGASARGEFGIVGIVRTDWVGPVPPSTDAAATLAVALWSVVFFGAIML